MTVKIILLAGLCMFGGCVHLPTPAPPNNLLSAEEHMTLGNTYLSQQKKDLAVHQYEAALQSQKNYLPALVALGNIAFGEKDLKKAHSYFERAQKIAPKDPTVVNNLATVCLAEGQDLKGIDIMVEDALEGAGPTTPYLWDTLANIAIQERRFEDAKKALKKAAETAPPDEPAFQKRLKESQERLAAASNPKAE